MYCGKHNKQTLHSSWIHQISPEQTNVLMVLVVHLQNQGRSMQ